MRVLLVSPRFHGYHAAIATSLAQRGHVVTTHRYDHNGGIAGRGWHQLRHRLPHKIGAGALRGLGREQTAGAVRAVRETHAQAVVVVKGDTLGADFWEAIDGLPRVTWLYDEMRRTQWTRERLAVIGPLATYSAHDAADLADAVPGVRHLPLAFDHRLLPNPTTVRTPQVSFVGARYPSREAVLALLHERGVPVRAYGRDWSSHPIDRLRTWRVATPDLPAERDVSRARAYDVMASSAATLNLHGDQDGFTMRTFEAAGVGGVELIDRDDVADLYDPGTEVLPWTSGDELVELCHRVERDHEWAGRIRRAARARTLADHTFDQRASVLEDLWHTA